MKMRIDLVLLSLMVASVPSQAAVSEPYSPLNRDATRQERSQPQQIQPVPPASKQASQQLQQPATPATAPAQKYSPAGPLTKQRTSQATTAAQNQIDEARFVSHQWSPPQWISWGYLRAYQPETLQRMLGAANSGKVPRSAVAGVVPAAQLDHLLKSSAPPAAVTAATNGLPPTATGQIRPPAATRLDRDTLGAARSSNPSGVTVVAALRSLPFQPTPNQLEFGNIMLGQKHSKTVRFIAPVNGELRATVSDPAFQIRRMRSLTGTFSLQTVPVKLPSGVTIQSVNPVPNVSQQRTSAPWAIPVRAGEDVEVSIEVSRDPSVALGEHAGQLRINLPNTLGASVGASVPVHARLDGRLYGFGINVDDSFSVLAGRDFLLPFEWANDGEAGEATITLENPPVGFSSTTPTQTIKLGKGERRQGAFAINVSNALQKSDYQFRNLNLLVVNGPVRWSYGVTVNIIPSWLMRSVTAYSKFSDGEEISVYGVMQIRSDGWFQFEGRITNSNPDFVETKIYRYDVGIALPGGFNHTVHGSFGKGSIGSTATRESRWSESGMNAQLANNFIAAAGGLGYAATYPYIKVTKSSF